MCDGDAGAVQAEVGVPVDVTHGDVRGGVVHAATLSDIRVRVGVCTCVGTCNSGECVGDVGMGVDVRVGVAGGVVHVGDGERDSDVRLERRAVRLEEMRRMSSYKHNNMHEFMTLNHAYACELACIRTRSCVFSCSASISCVCTKKYIYTMRHVRVTRTRRAHGDTMLCHAISPALPPSSPPSPPSPPPPHAPSPSSPSSVPYTLSTVACRTRYRHAWHPCDAVVVCRCHDIVWRACSGA